MSAGIAHRLRAAAAGLKGERISVDGLLQAHGPAAQGSLLLLLAVPCLLPIPGTGTVLGLGLLLMAAAIWRGQADAGLPSRVAQLEVSRRWAERVLTLLAWLYAAAARVTRQRLDGLPIASSRRVVGACVGAMALVLVLPIPFGNVLPALALMLIGLGLVFRDGVAIAAGLLMAVSTAVLTLALMLTAADWVVSWAVRAVA